MNDPRLTRAHRGLADALIHLARHARGGVAAERDGLLLFCGEHSYPGPYCNGMLSLGAPAGQALREAREFFAARRRGFVVWTLDGADAELERLCRASGWTQRPPLEGMPILVCEGPLARQRDGGPAVKRIVTDADADAYLGLVALAY